MCLDKRCIYSFARANCDRDSEKNKTLCKSIHTHTRARARTSNRSHPRREFHVEKITIKQQRPAEPASQPAVASLLRIMCAMAAAAAPKSNKERNKEKRHTCTLFHACVYCDNTNQRNRECRCKSECLNV